MILDEVDDFKEILLFSYAWRGSWNFAKLTRTVSLMSAAHERAGTLNYPVTLSRVGRQLLLS